VKHFPTIHWSARTQSGSRKPDNDDAWLIFSAGKDGRQRMSQDGSFQLGDDDLVLAISDGMGGGQAGDLASRLILSMLSTLIPQFHKEEQEGLSPSYKECLHNAIEKVHESINRHGEQDPTLRGMGATLTLAWLTENMLHYAHVGDSRLYHHRYGETEQITEDHTFAWRQLHRGELTEYAFRYHPRRSILYQVIGAGHHNLRVDYGTIPFQTGDKFLLCSDGIIDGAWQKNIHATLNEKTDSTSEPAESLVSRAITNDGTDDTTLILFHVK